MKSSKLLLRLVQILTTVIIAATLAMLLALGGILTLEKKDFTNRNSAETGKVRRPQNSGNKSVQELMYAGDRAIFAGNFDLALSYYQQASQIAPKDPAPYEKIGDIYFKEATYESALQNFRLASSLAPKNQLVILKSTRSLFGLRKIEEAKIELEKITPETPDTIYYKGIVAAVLNDHGGAQAQLNKSRSSTTDADLTKKVETVMSVYELYNVSRDASIEYLQTLLAQAMDQNKEYGLAIALAFDAIKTEHNYRDAWIVLGHAFLNENKWLDSEDALTKAIDLDSNHSVPYFFRGIARRNLKKPLDALADFERAAKLGFRPEIFIKQNMADSYFDLGNLEKAFPLYKDVAIKDPADIDVFVRPMAIAINHLSKPDEAISLARKAYESHPETAMAENLLGWAAIANDDLSAARDHLTRALKRDPMLTAAHLNLGLLNEKEGDTQAAMQSYKKAKELAEETGDISIGNTARIRYNHLKDMPIGPAAETSGSATGAYQPEANTGATSLSLE